MSLAHPKTCDIGSYFFYGPPFTAGDWDADGGGFTFNPTNIFTSISGSNLTSWAYLALVNVAGLHVEMVFDHQNDGNVGILGLLDLSGIGVAPSSYDTGLDPSNQSAGASANGAWFLNTGGGQSAFIGRNGSSSFLDQSLSSNTPYLANHITIDVGPDQGGFVYAVTVRLECPEAGIDDTQILTLSGASASGFLVLSGPYDHSAANIFTVNYLYVTSPYSANFNSPETCRGPVPSASEVLRDSTGKLTHAGIYRMPGGEAQASLLHNEFKAAT